MSLRQFVIIAVVSTIKVAEAIHCSDPEMHTISTIIGTSDLETCMNDTSYNCSDECVAGFSALAEALPECRDTDGINWYYTLSYIGWWCTLPIGRECSVAEINETESTESLYKDVKIECFGDSCSTECLDMYKNVSEALPNCTKPDGKSPKENAEKKIWLCEYNSANRTKSSASDYDRACTDGEDTQATNSARKIDDCLGEPCSIDCQEFLQNYLVILPNCMASDGVNHYQEVMSITEKCYAEPVDSSTTGNASSRVVGDSSTSSRLGSVAELVLVAGLCLAYSVYHL